MRIKVPFKEVSFSGYRNIGRSAYIRVMCLFYFCEHIRIAYSSDSEVSRIKDLEH